MLPPDTRIGDRLRITCEGVVVKGSGFLTLRLDGACAGVTPFSAVEASARTFVVERLVDEEAELLELLREARKAFPGEEMAAMMERLKAAIANG